VASRQGGPGTRSHLAPDRRSVGPHPRLRRQSLVNGPRRDRTLSRTGPTPTPPKPVSDSRGNAPRPAERPRIPCPRSRALRPHRSLPRAVGTARTIRLDPDRQQRDPSRTAPLEPDRRLALRPRRRRDPVRRRGERHRDELPGCRHRLDRGGQPRGGPRSPRWDPVDVDTIAVRTALSESASTPIPDRIRPRTVTRPFVVGDHRLETEPGEPFVRCTACGCRFRSKDAITGRDCHGRSGQ